ncbi:hypothetical protein BDV32DRAFT_124336 [Aspergillus pseudonomiae]|nr:hypothetical protein BDV32DRAFT_124336 [Aspergillus pseudonomiae]
MILSLMVLLCYLMNIEIRVGERARTASMWSRDPRSLTALLADDVIILPIILLCLCSLLDMAYARLDHIRSV